MFNDIGISLSVGGRYNAPPGSNAARPKKVASKKKPRSLKDPAPPRLLKLVPKAKATARAGIAGCIPMLIRASESAGLEDPDGGDIWV